MNVSMTLNKPPCMLFHGYKAQVIAPLALSEELPIVTKGKKCKKASKKSHDQVVRLKRDDSTEQQITKRQHKYAPLTSAF